MTLQRYPLSADQIKVGDVTSPPPPPGEPPAKASKQAVCNVAMPVKKLERYALSGDQVKVGDVELAGAESTWKHGEIFFEETAQVCKYLLIPEHVTDPMEVISCLFTKWGMKKPNMVCSVASGIGNYMHHDTHE